MRRRVLMLPCMVEPGISCIALGNDPICLSCHEGATAPSKVNAMSESRKEAI